MATRRRWLQFSLRGFFVLLTAFAVWLGVIVNRAREQREAVKEIRAMGGAVAYDWQLPNNQATQSAWGRLFGDDYFHNAELVWFYNFPPRRPPDILKSVPYLRRLRGLKFVTLPLMESNETVKTLEAALPGREVYRGSHW